MDKGCWNQSQCCATHFYLAVSGWAARPLGWTLSSHPAVENYWICSYCGKLQNSSISVTRGSLLRCKKKKKRILQVRRSAQADWGVTRVSILELDGCWFSDFWLLTTCLRVILLPGVSVSVSLRYFLALHCHLTATKFRVVGWRMYPHLTDTLPPMFSLHWVYI